MLQGPHGKRSASLVPRVGFHFYPAAFAYCFCLASSRSFSGCILDMHLASVGMGICRKHLCKYHVLRAAPFYVSPEEYKLWNTNLEPDSGGVFADRRTLQRLVFLSFRLIIYCILGKRTFWRNQRNLKKAPGSRKCVFLTVVLAP